MRVRGYNLFKRAFFSACTILLLVSVAQVASADSFAGLNMFGFPVTGSGTSDLSGITSSDGVLSANSASFSPSNQITGYLGSGLSGIMLGMGFSYPVASHDASTVAFSRSVAFESLFGDDAIAFPGMSAGLDTTWSSFPTISSTNGDIRYMENVQFQVSTVSDTMPMPMTGFSFPSGFFSGFFL